MSLMYPDLLVMAEDNLLVLPPEHANNQALGKQGKSIPHVWRGGCDSKLVKYTGEYTL